MGPARTITAELPPGGDTWARLAALYQPGRGRRGPRGRRRTRPVVVSGDCTTSLGIVAGLQRAGLDPGIVWFDAHGDVQTPETTASGYLGGMPLRLLAGYRPELIAAAWGCGRSPSTGSCWPAPGTWIRPRSPTWPARPSARPGSRTSTRPRCRPGRCTCTSTWT